MVPDPSVGRAIPDNLGPFDAGTNGVCAQGHPLNALGRCQPLVTGVELVPQSSILDPGTPSVTVQTGAGDSV